MKVKVIFIMLGALAALAFTADGFVRLVYPSHFPEPIYSFERNPLTAEKIALSRKLFYDPILSKDNSISCASCHSPYNAFAHTDHDLSHGIYDSIGTRNAPALFNLAWQKEMMWDGAIHHLDVQALAPLSHPSEMAENIAHVVMKLQNTQHYRTAFYKAWHDSTITGEHFLKSIAQFQLTLVSANAKYDQVKLGTTEFTEQEKAGFALFKTHCNSCHTEPLFSSYGFANNGLPVDSTLNDFGKYGITKIAKDSLKFKIPSLRNLSYTYPYMHDGRFKKLREVLNHYNQLKGSETSEIALQKPFHLSEKDKTDLIAFLLTLNDKTFVFNPDNKFPRELIPTEKQ